MSAFLLAPHRLYLVIGGIFGLLFALLTPPFGGSDEPAHFERSYEIASGAWLGARELPAALLAFEKQGFDQVVAGTPFTREDYAQLLNFRIDGETGPDDPNLRMFKVHNPLAYLHIAAAMQIGIALDAPLLVTFYLCRLTALLAGLLLIGAALKTMPSHRYLLCAVALLPTLVFFSGMLNPESLNVGLSFLFAALLLQYRQRATALSVRSALALIGLAFWLAQCKTAYLLLPFMACILPAACFHSRRHRIWLLLGIIMPGILCSLGWGILAKHHILDALPPYATEGGDHVDPNAQMQHILTHPVTYAVTLARSLLASDLLPQALRGFVGQLGWSNVLLPVWAYALAFAALFMLYVGAPDPSPRLRLICRLLAAAAVGGSLLLALTLLYMQWTGLKAPVIEGFQGRYLFTLMPWFVMLSTRQQAALTSSQAGGLLALSSTLLLGTALHALWSHYFA